jgi:hypothetical protein
MRTNESSGGASGVLATKKQNSNHSVARFSVFKGWFGEKLATFGLWLGLDDNIYRHHKNSLQSCVRFRHFLGTILCQPKKRRST